MISYKDRAFCSSDCTRAECFRFAGIEVQTEAAAKDLPINYLDFSGACEHYKPKDGIERR